LASCEWGRAWLAKQINILAGYFSGSENKDTCIGTTLWLAVFSAVKTSQEVKQRLGQYFPVQQKYSFSRRKGVLVSQGF
jgi:hypothetical protein